MRAKKEATLSSAFWLYIFNNDFASREDVESYFATCEQSEALKTLPQTAKGALDYCFARMNYAHGDPRSALWFTFWDDFWAENKDMEALQGKADAFDPKNSASIAYKPKKREDLDAFLTEQGLRHATKLFNDALADMLYAEMDKKGAETPQ